VVYATLTIQLISFFFIITPLYFLKNATEGETTLSNIPLPHTATIERALKKEDNNVNPLCITSMIK